SVLRAIRNVNQLISRESDGDRLLPGICRTLVDSRGYLRAWIVLTDHGGRPNLAADSGTEGAATGKSAEELVRLAEQAVAAHGVTTLESGCQGGPAGPQPHAASTGSCATGPSLLALTLAHGG